MKLRLILLATLILGIGAGVGLAQVDWTPAAHAQTTITKEALRTQVMSNGFQVEPVADWKLVGEVNNVRKYDVAYEYQGTFAIAQVMVTDEGTANENAEVLTRLVVPTPTTTFNERLTTYLRSLESGAVWALSRVSANETDGTATVYAYITNGSTLTQKTFIVRERNDTFSYQELL